jgi:bifunctional non-homologous end joining protein LigD
MATRRPKTRAAHPAASGASFFEPMLCTLVAEPFDDPGWLFEPKFDGLRLIVRFDGRQLSLMSRNGKEQAIAFPDLADALRAALRKPCMVDGEAVCFDERGHTSFRVLQQRFHLTNLAEIEARMKTFPASIFVFDILDLEGKRLTELPLVERKPILRKAVRWNDRVLWTEGHPGEGIAYFKKACRAGEEGIIGKRLESRYVSGRSRDWVKIKCVAKQEFVIGGYTNPRGSRVGLGALLIGYYSDGGKSLLYAGKVGTGFARETLIDLHRQLSALEQPRPAFAPSEELPREGVHWVRPKLVAEIAFTEWTQHGLLRHPRFEGLRTDKDPHDVHRERPKSGAEEAAILQPKPAPSPRKRREK